MARSSDSFNRAVVIRPEDVCRCWNILDQCFREISATVRCTDGLTRDFTSLDTLLAYDNSAVRKIHTLEVMGSGEGSATIEIATVDSYRPGPVEIRLSCDEPDLRKIRRDLLELFGDAKAWFSVFVKIRIEFIYIGSLFLLWQTLVFMNSGETSGEERSFASALLTTLLGMGFIALFAGVGFGLVKVQNRYFPRVVFTLGQGQKRFETDDKVRWVIITSGIGLMVAAIKGLL